MSKKTVDTFFEDMEKKTFGKGGLFTESEVEDLDEMNDIELENEADDIEDELANDEDVEEVDEGIGLGSSLSKALKAIDSLNDKDRATLATSIRAVQPKTGIGTPATNRLKKAGTLAAGDDVEGMDYEEPKEIEEMARQDTVGSHKPKVSTKEGKTVVTYHATDVVGFDGNTVVLNTGGWKTPTTKTRMNQAANQYDLGYSVYQRKGQWFVDTDGKTIPFEGDTVEFPKKSFNQQQGANQEASGGEDAPVDAPAEV